MVKNGVRAYLEKLAADAKWGDLVLGKEAAKTKAKEYVASAERLHFEAELKERSTLAMYADVVQKDRAGLPEYLKRACPCGLRQGRRLKTKFRLGVHQLQGSLARMVPRGGRAAASRCPCCDAGVGETVQHALFGCRSHDAIRADFFERAEEVYPEFGAMSTDARFRLMMSEDTPMKIDGVLYS